MDHDINDEKLVEMAVSGLSWGHALTFEDHFDTVFDECGIDDDVEFQEAVHGAGIMASNIIDLGTHIAQKKPVWSVLIIDQGIPDAPMTFINEADAKQYMLDMVKETILDYDKSWIYWENETNEHSEELLAKGRWANGYFCCYDIEFRAYGSVIQ